MTTIGKASAAAPSGSGAASLEFSPQERKQTNLELVEHLINVNGSPKSDNGQKAKAGGQSVNGSSPISHKANDANVKRRLKLSKRIRKDASPNNNHSNNDKERDAKTLELLQKINVSLTQEVTMLREQRDQAVRAATTASDRLEKLLKENSSEKTQNARDKSEENVLLEEEKGERCNVDDHKGDTNLVENAISAKTHDLATAMDSKYGTSTKTIRLETGLECDGEIDVPVSSPLGASNRESLLESEIKELKQQLDKKEKTVAFFRLELLEEKDSAKKERATLKSEIDHLKRQNVVNANRVVILEDELRSVREGRDEENTAEVIEALTRENEDLKNQMERSLGNMRKMSTSLKKKEENEINLKKELEIARVNELDAKEELESCRKAQQKAIADNAKLCSQLENFATSTKALEASSKISNSPGEQLGQSKNDITLPNIPPIYSNNDPKVHDNPTPRSLSRSIDNNSIVESEGLSEPTPKAINTVASKYQRPDVKGESAFLSCLASINDTIDKEAEARRSWKTPKSDSQSYVDAPPKIPMSYRVPSNSGEPSQGKKLPNFPAISSLSSTDFNPPVVFEPLSVVKQSESRFGAPVVIPPKLKGNNNHTIEKDDDAATFNDEIEDISVAYESISRRPKHNIQNKTSLYKAGSSSKQLAPFRLPDLTRTNARRYDNDDEDVLSVDLSLKERQVKDLPQSSTNQVNIAEQQQQLSDVLSGMLTFLDSAISEPLTVPAIPRNKPPLQNTQDNEFPKKQTESDSSGQHSEFPMKQVEFDSSGQETCEVDVGNVDCEVAMQTDTSTIQSLQRTIKKLEGKLADSTSTIDHLEQQNLFIKKNYNDTVELLQKDADDSKLLKEEVEAKYRAELLQMESRVRDETILKNKIREYEYTLEAFEHAVASQNEVMMELVKELERLQMQDISEKDFLGTPSRAEDDSSVEDCSLSGEHIELDGDTLQNQEHFDPSNDDNNADFEVKDILLAEDGTPIVVKEIVTSNDSSNILQANSCSQDVGVMRAWKHNEMDNNDVQLVNSSNPTLAMISTLLVTLGKNKENEAMRKKLEEQLAAKHVTVEALGEAATQANESIREIVSQLHSKTYLLEKEKVRRERLELLLNERDLVLVTVANAISQQESIMKNLEKELEEIDLVDISSINSHESVKLSSMNRSINKRSENNVLDYCNNCEDKDRTIRELELAIEESHTTQVTLAEELTNLRGLQADIENNHKVQVKSMSDLLNAANENVQRMEIKVKLMLNNSDEVVESLRSKVNKTQDGTSDLSGEISAQLSLLRYKEELLGDELDQRLRDKTKVNETLLQVEQTTSNIEAFLQKCDKIHTPIETLTEASTDVSLDHSYNEEHQVTVIDTQILTDIHEQLSSLHKFEDDLKGNLLQFETDNEILDEGFGMSLGDRKSLRKLREELALFLGNSRASLHQLEDKVSEYMGSIGEERYSRIKDLELQLKEKEKSMKLMEKQSAYQEQTLQNLRMELDKRKKGRSGLFTR